MLLLSDSSTPLDDGSDLDFEAELSREKKLPSSTSSEGLSFPELLVDTRGRADGGGGLLTTGGAGFLVKV